jgi:predicted nucleotidyltransferase
MNATDPNVQRVEVVAAALGDLCAELVLVGGCAASLLINAPTAAPSRVTYDVDLLVELAALRDYHAMEKQFALRGFQRDMAADAPICRWRLGAAQVDLMPTDEAVLGFGNRWYQFAAVSAQQLALPSGREIRLISAPAFLATKFEAFWSRGKGDPITSHDLEDIINVLEGRLSIEADIQACTHNLQVYLAEQCGKLLALPHFGSVLPGLLAYDDLHAQRVAAMMQKIRYISALPW